MMHLKLASPSGPHLPAPPPVELPNAHYWMEVARSRALLDGQKALARAIARMMQEHRPAKVRRTV